MRILPKLWLAGILLLASCTQRQPAAALIVPEISESSPAAPVARQPKNIVLLIGDGMGISQISAGLYANNNTLFLEKFPITGLMKTHAADNLITDSAAGATAFASGVKTYNGAIGVNRDTLPVQTIVEQAEIRGLATGLISTASIVHATPAAFYAHQESRKYYEEIAADLLLTEIDLFIGGGYKYFTNRKNDSRNLYKELQSKGYALSDYTQGPLSALEFSPGQNLGYFTAEEEPVSLEEGRNYLVEASQKALPFLDQRSKKGFFLMIEGAQIDWGGHDNNTEYIISEMIEFDQAIGKVLEFAQEDGQTLVIVTADHETGGFSINLGSTMDQIIGDFTSKGHTATLVPVFAYGPGAEYFSGIFDNTDLYDKMRDLLRLDRDR